MADQRVVAADGGGPSKETLALASEVFDRFCAANTLRSILSLHRHLCDLLRIKPTNFPQFYPKIRGRLRSWKAEAIWAKYDKRASHKCYSRGRACPNTKVFVIGAGPCGLRTAIEAQLLGAKVVVVEKRDRISRNNVLHLWPFVIHDLRALGAKKFFGKFCAGSIDHISIRQLQCILLKVALLLGVEIHEGVSFEGLIPPPEDQSERIGWRARISPEDHPVSQYEFDVLIGADGKRNTLDGFKRKEFRGKLAIAITVNFINKHTEAEARVPEISGIAFIFRQKFFQEMRASTGIDLENIVYYKDETHYFVMTAKKHSLLAKGVILQDYANTAKLLSPENVDREALLSYAREAANFATEGKLPHLEPAVNHHNQPDVAMFDFTSLYAAENASRVVERRGHRLLMLLVGDSLTEPFWPTGSGCARGFLSSMNGCWAIRSWGQLGPPSIPVPDTPTPPTSMIIDDDHVKNGDGNKENEMDSGGQKGTPKTPTTPHSPAPKRSVYAILEVLAERESLYRLLGQVSPDNMSRDFDSYTLDPHTRYLSLNTQSVLPYQVRPLYDTDDRSALSFDPPVGPVPGISDHPKRRRKRAKDTQVHPDMLLQWLKRQVALYDGITVEDMTKSFKDGLALCAVIHRYRPDLLDFHSLDPSQVAHNNQLAFDTLEREFGIPPVMTGLEMEQCDVPDKLTMLTYLSQVYDTFRGEIPHIKHPKLQDDIDFLAEEAAAAAEAAALQQARLRKLGSLSHSQKASFITRIVSSATHKPIPHPLVVYAKRSGTSSTPTSVISPAPASVSSVAEPSSASLRRTRKRRSSDKAFTSAERREIQEEIARNRLERQRRRQYQRQLATQRFHKSLAMLQANARHTTGSDDEENSPFMDYNILFYRMTAPSFEDRVRDIENKILYPDRDARIQAEIRKGRSSKGGTGVPDPEFSGRVKNIEDKLKGNAPVEKRPKDLLRAIGKIEKSDWNVREIEKKMEENKMGKLNRQNKAERVPKWNQEKFQDKFMAVERKLCGKDNETSDKYAEIDRSLKHFDRKIKEGIAIEPTGPRGANKVSAMAEQFSTKPKDDTETKEEAPEPSIPRSNSRGALAIVPQGSEICHFCGKRVYLMERLSAEGCFFHRGCFRCEYCSTTLRLGNYAFDRDGKYGSHFFCVQHFGLQGLLNGAVRIGSKARNKGSGVSATGTKERHSRNRKSGAKDKAAEETPAIEEKENAIQVHTPAKGKSSTPGTTGRKSGEGKRRSKGSGSKFGTPRIAPAAVVEPVPFLTPPYIPEEEVDLGDRGTTPERIEFENTSIPVTEICKTEEGVEGNMKSLGEGEPSKRVASVEELPQMDEEEWINRNFGASAAEDASDDDDDDDSSDFSNDEAEVNVEVGGIANLGEDLAERRKKTWKGKGDKEVDEDEDEVFEEAMAEPLMTAEQTRLFAEKWKRRYSKDVVEDGAAAGDDGRNGKEGGDEDEESSDSYGSGESDDYEDEDEDEEDSDTATEGDEEEGEELVKARELRKQEFHLKVPERQRKAHGSGGDQGSDTEVKLPNVNHTDLPNSSEVTSNSISKEPLVNVSDKSGSKVDLITSANDYSSSSKSDSKIKCKKTVAILKSEFLNSPSPSAKSLSSENLLNSDERSRFMNSPSPSLKSCSSDIAPDVEEAGKSLDELLSSAKDSFPEIASNGNGNPKVPDILAHPPNNQPFEVEHDSKEKTKLLGKLEDKLNINAPGSSSDVKNKNKWLNSPTLSVKSHSSEVSSDGKEKSKLLRSPTPSLKSLSSDNAPDSEEKKSPILLVKCHLSNGHLDSKEKSKLLNSPSPSLRSISSDVRSDSQEKNEFLSSTSLSTKDYSSEALPYMKEKIEFLNGSIHTAKSDHSEVMSDIKRKDSNDLASSDSQLPKADSDTLGNNDKRGDDLLKEVKPAEAHISAKGKENGESASPISKPPERSYLREKRPSVIDGLKYPIPPERRKSSIDSYDKRRLSYVSSVPSTRSSYVSSSTRSSYVPTSTRSSYIPSSTSSSYIPTTSTSRSSYIPSSSRNSSLTSRIRGISSPYHSKSTDKERCTIS